MFYAAVLCCFVAIAFAKPHDGPGILKRLNGWEKRTTDDCATKPELETVDDGGLEDEMLAAHNEARAAHDVDPVTWDGTLAKQAQDWADAKAEDVCTKELKAHSDRTGTGVGENVYVSGNCSAHARHAVALWYSEKVLPEPYNYKWEDGHTLESILKDAYHIIPMGQLHFTAILWKDVKTIGCGRSIVHYGSKCLLTIVCQYKDPFGMVNNLMHFSDEVIPADSLNVDSPT